jgi:uncharacterized protein YggU (UPF0235/DUF167 family)
MNTIKLFCKVFLKKDKKDIKLDQSGVLIIYINSIREKGKANKAIIDLISTVFLIKKYNINIISGFTTLQKVIEINTEKKKEDLFSLL